MTEDAAHTLTSRAFAVVKLDSKGNLVTTFGDAGKQVVKYATDSVDEPPVGVVLNVVCGVSRIRMEDIIKGVWPFMIAQLVVLFLMVLFPQLVTVPAKWFGG